ncbi:MAG: hypothetical protein ACPGEF_03460, partial [Endozoicomonas sp.]
YVVVNACALWVIAHPDHLLFVGLLGFPLLPPSSILKSIMYKTGLNSEAIKHRRGEALRQE